MGFPALKKEVMHDARPGSSEPLQPPAQPAGFLNELHLPFCASHWLPPRAAQEPEGHLGARVFLQTSLVTTVPQAPDDFSLSIAPGTKQELVDSNAGSLQERAGRALWKTGRFLMT